MVSRQAKQNILLMVTAVFWGRPRSRDDARFTAGQVRVHHSSMATYDKATIVAWLENAGLEQSRHLDNRR